jgi:hypothetical protein
MEEINIDDVIQIVLAVIKSIKTPAIPIDSNLIAVGGFLRPGLSAGEMARKIIEGQQLAGVPIGNLPSGAENVAEKMERIRMEVITESLLENVKLSIVIPPGIPVQVVGVSPSGTVVAAGSTTGIGIGTGILS